MMCAVLAAEPPARKSIDWCDIWISHANETKQPRVLLIGDSIVRDYYPEVEKVLGGKAALNSIAMTSTTMARVANYCGFSFGGS